MNRVKLGLYQLGRLSVCLQLVVAVILVGKWRNRKEIFKFRGLNRPKDLVPGAGLEPALYH